MQRGQRAGGATQLHGEVLPDRPQATAGSVEAFSPTGRYRPERGGHCLLQQRSSGHRGVSMVACEYGACVGRTVESAADDGRRPVRHQHGRGVEDVLAGGTEMDDRSGVLIRGLRERDPKPADQRDHRVAVGGGLPTELARIVGGRLRAGSLDLRRRRTVDQSYRRAGTSQCGFDVTQCAEPGAVVGGGGDRGRTEDRIPQGTHRFTVLLAQHDRTDVFAIRSRRTGSRRDPVSGCRNAGRRSPAPPLSTGAAVQVRARAAPDRSRWPRPRRGSRSS